MSEFKRKLDDHLEATYEQRQYERRLNTILLAAFVAYLLAVVYILVKCFLRFTS